MIVVQTVIAFLIAYFCGQAPLCSKCNTILLIPFFASAIFNTQFTLFNRRFDDRMPKIADKNYTEKRLEILDEVKSSKIDCII
ncbi:hypothetical protein ACVNPZ_01075 [Staphylococcus aureus]